MCTLVNSSFREKKVPDLFKTTLIVPVLKKNKNRLLSSSYRPVAILPSLCKVIERVVLEQLTRYCDEHRIIPRQQHGFRRAHSTLTAIASATHAWGTALAPHNEGGKAVDCVAVAAFDYSAAFDTVSLDTVMSSLERLGCGGPTLAWFRSYMSGGRQAVI